MFGASIGAPFGNIVYKFLPFGIAFVAVLGLSHGLPIAILIVQIVCFTKPVDASHNSISKTFLPSSLFFGGFSLILRSILSRILIEVVFID